VVRLGVGLAKVLASALLAILVFLTGAFFQVRGALPPYSGHVDAKGLKAPVEILRDKNAVPHIIAGSLEDAAFGLGYVHAQDRFWQMELMRRLGQGRLSEIVPPRLVGSGLIDTDRTMRGLGIYRKAADSVNALSPAMRAIIDSYAAGVNAWLARDDQQFGLELTVIKLLSGGRYRPEAWQPADSLVWAKLMALGLDGNWRAELLRLRLARKVGTDTVKFLIEPSGDNQDATLSMANEALKRTDLDRLYRETDNIATRKREASNEWVLSAAHSVSDKPLLANDPHLGLGFPGTWYLARLVGPGFDIRGATSPGSPAVVLGHNGTIGWGFTTTNLDSQDLFVERVDPTDPNHCYNGSVSPSTYWREELFRIDHTVSSKIRASFRYVHDSWDTSVLTPQWGIVRNTFPTVQNKFTGPGTSLVARLTDTISPTLLNDLVVSYVNSNIMLVDQNGPGGAQFQRNPALDQPLVGDPSAPAQCNPQLSLDPVSLIPQCAMGYIFNNGFGGKMPGVNFLGTNAAYGGRGFAADPSYMPWTHTDPTYALRDDVGKSIGKHTLQFGAQYVLSQRNQTNNAIGAASGDYDFGALPSKGNRRRAADARGSACDQGNFSVENGQGETPSSNGSTIHVAHSVPLVVSICSPNLYREW